MVGEKLLPKNNTPKMEDNSNAHKKRYLVIIVLILIISILGVALGIQYLLKGPGIFRAQIRCGEGDQRETVTLDTTSLTEVTEDFPWWNDEYSYFKQISLVNENKISKLETYCWITIEFDHSFFVSEKKSRADGLDLKLLYLENNAYQEIPFELIDPNTKNTKISFQLIKDLPHGEKDNQYFLYYGNSVASVNESILPSKGDDAVLAYNYKIHRTREVHPKILGKINRQWIIKETTIEKGYSEILYTVDVDYSLQAKNPPQYAILGTSKTGIMAMNLAGEYESHIGISDLSAGTYQIQSTVNSDNTDYISPKTGFFISYPLYVSMTLDWEGLDTSDDQLAEIDNFSKRHNSLPITHLFNPRIYVTSEVSQDRTEYLTQWIQLRRINGDEIGMHLHMHYDMISQAGVTPRSSPKWTNYLNNGHDVPCSAYTYEEFMQILAWANNEFLKQGLGVPKSFRAGGWFADLKVLAALNDSGFIIDTSGRDSYSWGQNRLKGYWNLSSTTRPYHPSKSNQNSPSPQPTFSLWEFPNNGADSYFFKSDDLMSRFNDNYKKQPMVQAQTITYLSHPHAFTGDIDVLDPVFAYTDQYLASLDQGPVIYVTLEQAHNDYYKHR